MKTILLGVSGSISAYKAADITSRLMKLGYSVEVIMTTNSTKFITPLTLQALSKRPVHTEVMEEIYPEQINHIELAKKADLFLVAPASANIIGKLANGIADDMLSTIALALKEEVPKVIAPAMNTYMYQNLIMQRNLNTLKEIGYQELEPREALLACGDFGRGALAEVDEIVAYVHQILDNVH
ncbi:phosphopantothenoylcysteine decarboxylase [Enterococcus sp. BWB1-3]|uniref:phosphopantothenoylcysteine decarboxylase n=1 Tax=unclassified Enterococcus TaxID=2608891 RepID=UPI001920DF28|nr:MULTISPECIES: phosphopantothenoylcysteine decarboxylase [unclassified Enterococcus]MBL1230016.1 phosphopantothenoylcysteine decarboxylase [Enterococcus sp. BWB1-3]MCB5955376.1 phosphopantothenoylcysteine decarboxylase [Enterococcus sp. CWB-B31]